MDNVLLLKERIAGLKNAIERDFMPRIAKDLAPRLEDKIIEQLDRGERGDGKILPHYSPVSVEVYGKPPGPIRLEDTGDFRRAIIIIVSEDGIEFISTDPKSNMLMQDYGEEILDLTPRSIGEFNEDDLLIELQKFVYEYLLQ